MSGPTPRHQFIAEATSLREQILPRVYDKPVEAAAEFPDLIHLPGKNATASGVPRRCAGLKRANRILSFVPEELWRRL